MNLSALVQFENQLWESASCGFLKEVAEPVLVNSFEIGNKDFFLVE